jgi:long-subunit acyl-CoA synthetase (AMP-forming)/GNAT superfamily N-acetyltransferase
MSEFQANVKQLLDPWRGYQSAGIKGGATALLQASEAFMAQEGGDESAFWREWLDATGRPQYLTDLPNPESRSQWADLAVGAIRKSGYGLYEMVSRRADEHPERTLFREVDGGELIDWSWEVIWRRVQSYAATLLADSSKPPRVALFTSNSVDGACVDLACLTHGILITPLNIHFDIETLGWIFQRLSITVAVADSEERLNRLLDVKRLEKSDITILALEPNRITQRGKVQHLAELADRIPNTRQEDLLANRPHRTLDETATVMFTSGSTGRPKGVCFSEMNLVSKRFCRAAALPEVGKDEVLFCYLPLFHTFGRYLELLGMVFWRGVYTFAGNPSTETFFARMPIVQPTGLISIPLRWMQIRERALDEMDMSNRNKTSREILAEIAGSRLRWGLSAAGYLDPKVFRYFHSNDIALCSGFGMTEATGGITMNPPDEYVDDTVGLPLPGIDVTFSKQGEMRIAGPYVGRYLDPDGSDLETLPWTEERENGTGGYIPTGDIFKRLEGGHLSIVDRVKDIYKNVRGQTIAPRKVEKKFAGVPGIVRVFLVGDHRSDNVLLIVPALDDPVLAQVDEGDRREYFNRIVAAANRDLAPFERVVNFEILHRDFSEEKGELTPKGSYKRNTIEKNFSDTIQTLYTSSQVELEIDDLHIRLPRWLLREMGTLEHEITTDGKALLDGSRDLSLRIESTGLGRWRIGDLEYAIDHGSLDLSLLSRQPLFWAGNPGLISFLPCKEGWDTPSRGIGNHLFLPVPQSEIREPIEPAGVSGARLLEINRLLQLALYDRGTLALNAVQELGDELAASDDRHGTLIRRRLASLATHPDEDVRALAYRVMLLDEPMPDYATAFPAFILSGKSFLTEESIQAIAAASFEQFRLDALRHRLIRYREQLAWPADEIVRDQFESLFRLLTDFVRYHPEFYKPVRAELASWTLHRVDPALAAFADRELNSLVQWYEDKLAAQSTRLDPDQFERYVVFDESLPTEVHAPLRKLLLDSTFLRQSVLLAFDDEAFDLDQLRDGGIWVREVVRRQEYRNLRVSISTITGRHYDLLVLLRSNLDEQWMRDRNHWIMVIAGQPFGIRRMPRFGCMRPELGALSLEYITDLTLWDKLKTLGSSDHPAIRAGGERPWRKRLVRGMATFFEAWEASGKNIVPGRIDPENVVVPEPDFREGALILSLAGLKEYSHPFDLFVPMVKSFFDRVRSEIPRAAEHCRIQWVFEAAAEALGETGARDLLTELREEIARSQSSPFDHTFLHTLDRTLLEMGRVPRVPLPLMNAVDRYHAWLHEEGEATEEAKLELIVGLIDLYRIDRFGELGRFMLFRRTWFSGVAPPASELYDRLIDHLHLHPERSSTQRVELPELQALLPERDREAFRTLVFPKSHHGQEVRVRSVGEAEEKQVFVATEIRDKFGDRYELREPVRPEEIGTLYRLLYQVNVPKPAHEDDRYLLLIDKSERIVGGMTWRQSGNLAVLDAIAVARPLQGRGLGVAQLEDLAGRLASAGIHVLKTAFMMREFLEPLGFKIDRRHGGLVRFLSPQDMVLRSDRNYPHSDI